jgi:AAA domain, putative AbiEii toxin, Type IV TA system
MRRSDLRRPRFVSDPRLSKEQFSVVYSFEMSADSESRDADYRVSRESIQIARGGVEFVAAERANATVSQTVGNFDSIGDPLVDLFEPLEDPSFWEYINETLVPTELMLSRLSFSPIVDALLGALGSTRLFQLSPVECRKPGASTPAPQLGRYGADLPAVVRHLRTHQKAAWKSITHAMRTIMPSLTEIRTEFTPDRQLALIFEEAGKRKWTANEVSDGTVQSLALFVCLFDRRNPLVLIEEPENALHPWIIRSFVDACRKVKDKQLVVTTHSPALIAYLRPDELDLMWRTDDGQSHLEPLTTVDNEAGDLWEKGDVDLFDLVDGGWIREAVPPGLQ